MRRGNLIHDKRCFLHVPPISLLRKETGKSMIPPRLFSDQKRRGGAVEKGPGGTPGFSPGPLFDRLFPFASANGKDSKRGFGVSPKLFSFLSFGYKREDKNKKWEIKKQSI